MLIGLTGPKQAGKDTVYERAKHIMRDVLPVERASFADLLYQSAAASLDVTVDDLRRWKNDPAVHVAVGAYYDDGTFFPAEVQTIRQYLQRYGTEAHRDVFGEDFWVENVKLDHADKLVFVTDVRFPNEAEAVQKAGGLLARVIGPAAVEGADDGHASEVGVPLTYCDWAIPNVERDDGYQALDHVVDVLLRTLLQREAA